MNDGAKLLNLMDRFIDPMRGKSQSVRLLDVFVLGPFMVYYAATTEEQPDWMRAALAFSGLATSVYNGANYLRIKRQHARTKTSGIRR